MIVFTRKGYLTAKKRSTAIPKIETKKEIWIFIRVHEIEFC